MTMRRRHFLGAAALAALPGFAAAQGFPAQPVRLIVPFAPGGPVDIFGRILARGLSDQLRQPVVLDNRPGAGGLVGMDVVAKAAPDGYTIGLGGPGALAVAPSLLPRMPFDPLRDLTPVAQAVGVPELLVVNKDVPARDVRALVALAKARPGGLNFASAGNGTFPHLAAELFRLRTGIEIVHVPYRGAAPAVTDLVAGRVQLMFVDAPVVLPQIRDGTLVPLGVASSTRFAALPDLPTLAEAGIPGIEAESWYGLVAPAGLPADRLETLHAALLATLAQPDTQRLLADQGARGIGDAPAAFAAHLRAETAKWGEVVRLAEVKPE
ncbi:Bug family tripartite tricarboxylate transporter substrate binding protein [Roseomonas sp. BN140053]|uniref:Bug family tripartite tricarboxylate transporter substrate binding protein n=1 Tax=Roseomonas sp. BN140053 TaxID=3391898 RepID=UPI0039E85630